MAFQSPVGRVGRGGGRAFLRLMARNPSRLLGAATAELGESVYSALLDSVDGSCAVDARMSLD